MRKMKRLLSALLCALLVFSMSAPVRAAEYSDTYTVRFYAGRQGVMRECSGGGEITGEGKIFVLRGLGYGSRISVSFRESTEDGSTGDVPAEGYNRFVMSIREEGTGNKAEVTFDVESKYYIMGSRESGKDNSERIGSILVKGDRDYVAAYGLMKDSVEYTINYLDEDGNVLRESEKYRGTIGDKPVIAYQYVEGYQPQAYNLTKTLSANAAENIFTFIYSPVTTPVNVIVIPGQPPEPGPVGPDQNVVDVVEGEQPEGPGPEGPGPEGPGPAGPGGEEELPDEPVPQVPIPEEVIDLDDPNLPQNPYEDGEDENKGGNGIFSMIMGNAFLVKMPVPVIAALLCVLAALLGGGIWWLIGCICRKKDKEEDKKEDKDEEASGEEPEEKS